MFAAICAVYFLPSIMSAMIAAVLWCRRQITINILLGWTVLGWIAAFIWALTAKAERRGVNRAALAATGLVLAGCAGGSVGDVKDNAATRFEFEAPGNYQQVYRDIAQAARNCWAGGYISPFGAERNVDADLFPDLKKGEITWWQSNIGSYYFATALIEPTEGGNTHVTVWNYYHTWDDIGRRVQLWAGGSTECS